MKRLHDWDLSYSQARDVQTRLAGKVRFTPLRKKAKLVAGIDCAFSKDGQKILASDAAFQAGLVIDDLGVAGS